MILIRLLDNETGQVLSSGELDESTITPDTMTSAIVRNINNGVIVGARLELTNGTLEYRRV